MSIGLGKHCCWCKRECKGCSRLPADTHPIRCTPPPCSSRPTQDTPHPPIRLVPGCMSRCRSSCSVDNFRTKRIRNKPHRHSCQRRIRCPSCMPAQGGVRHTNGWRCRRGSRQSSQRLCSSLALHSGCTLWCPCRGADWPDRELLHPSPVSPRWPSNRPMQVHHLFPPAPRNPPWFRPKQLPPLRYRPVLRCQASRHRFPTRRSKYLRPPDRRYHPGHSHPPRSHHLPISRPSAPSHRCRRHRCRQRQANHRSHLRPRGRRFRPSLRFHQNRSNPLRRTRRRRWA